MTDQYWGEEKSREQAKAAATREMVAQRRAILDALSLDQGERVLEVGSGNGVLAREMLEIVGASGHVCGIDSSGPMVKLAEQICPNGRFIEGDATDLPVEDLSFDAVTRVRFFVSFLTSTGRFRRCFVSSRTVVDWSSSIRIGGHSFGIAAIRL